MMHEKPGIVIAAPSSGSGKTTITISLIQALKNRGLKVKSFKCGPDYIDPMFHRSVLGIESGNLDLFFTDEARTKELYENKNDADISIIEGVMGLYDGLGGISDEASSYHLARTLDLPVVLVVNARGMGRSVLAQIAGFLAFDTEKLIKGVILNCVSETYFDRLKKLITDNLDVAVLGYLPMDKSIKIDSRHLGLTMPEENKEVIDSIKNTALRLEQTVDIDKLLDISGLGSDTCIKSFLADYDMEAEVEAAGDNKPVIAVARDEAFCFYYRENLELLEKNGARLEYFSPIHDKKLPDNVSGLILGGGYPELYARELSENYEMLREIKNAIMTGVPSLAECGGFMYLHKELETKDGMSYTMAGVIDGRCYYTGRLVRFGYISLTDKDGIFLKDNHLLRGHEFHYFDSTNNGEGLICRKPIVETEFSAGIVSENSWWGFAHLYYPSNEEFVHRFLMACREFI